MDTPQLLELSAERSISFRERGLAYTYRFGRITEKDWNRYFDGIASQSFNDGNALVTVLDYKTASSELVRSKVVAVDGYVDGFTDTPNWKEVLPIRHVRNVAALLMQVSVDESRLPPIDPLRQEAALKAVWTSPEPGRMTCYTGLVHQFSPVTAEHERKLNRTMSETRVVGGARNGRTIYPSRQRAFLALYDELIQRAEGYSVDGVALSEMSRNDVIREMDAYHKVLAVQQLFNESNADEDEAAE